ncbi:MAG: penicillin-binding protein 2 [Bacteroidales bacterium]|jgi:penicillin-binding protein 2|nr:penicillin-binding protein 2 [Bacteroidales bacterium]
MTVKKSYSPRRHVISAIFLVIILIFIVRLFLLQIIDESYKSSAKNNVFRYITEYPARGLVYDCNGKPLLYNEATYDLMVIPRQIKGIFDTNTLCNLTGIDKVTFQKRLNNAIKYSGFLPSIIEEKLTKEIYGILQEKLINYPGFYIQARTIRNYPQPYAAQVLGYIGEVWPEILEEDKYYRPGDYIGLSGLEKSYEIELRGKKGYRIIMVDVHGRDMGSYMNGKFDVEAKAGQDLYTSMDIELQSYAEMLLQNKRGSVVAIDPKTGGIIAISSSPSYDPNLLVGRERTKNYFKLISDKNLPLFNRALSGRYPPGSTFKPITGLIGLQEGVLTNTTAYPCYGGFPLGNGKMVKCHAHSSPLNLYGAIQTSCNAYFCKVLKTTLENKKYKNTSEAFEAWRNHALSLGLGKKLGVDLPSESDGNIPTRNYYDKYFGENRWRALTVISIAIGQGEILLTPLQLVNITAIIANRGYYYTPHIVKAFGKPTNYNKKFLKKYITNINPQYFDYIIEGMYGVVEGGTARNVKMDSIKVCGKTGTAQNAGKNHSIFIAFAPKENPKIAIAAVVENSGYGATWAAPVVSLMIEKYLTKKVKRPDLEKEIMESKFIDNNQ